MGKMTNRGSGLVVAIIFFFLFSFWPGFFFLYILEALDRIHDRVGLLFQMLEPNPARCLEFLTKY